MASRVADVIRMEVPLQVAALRRTLSPALVGSLPAIETAMHKVTAIAEAFDVAVTTAETAARLSPLGRREEVHKASRDGEAKLTAFESGSIAPYETRSVAVAGTLVAKPPAKDVLWEMRAQELRKPFAKLSLMERGALYASLPASAEYDELRQALETGPLTLEATPGQLAAVVPFVPASLVEAAIAARAASQNPATAKELHDLKLIVRTLRGLVASARHGINEVAGPADVPATV